MNRFLFIAMLLAASPAFALPCLDGRHDCAAGAAHVGGTVCDFRNADGALCTARDQWCYQDCGDEGVTMVVPPNSPPDTPPEIHITIIDTGNDMTGAEAVPAQ